MIQKQQEYDEVMPWTIAFEDVARNADFDFNDANAKDCNLNEKIGDKAQGVYGLVIAPLAQLP